MSHKYFSIFSCNKIVRHTLTFCVFVCIMHWYKSCTLIFLWHGPVAVAPGFKHSLDGGLPMKTARELKEKFKQDLFPRAMFALRAVIFTVLFAVAVAALGGCKMQRTDAQGRPLTDTAVADTVGGATNPHP